MTDTPIIESIVDAAERHAAARSTLYGLLAGCLRFPWQDFHAAALAGEIVPGLEQCLAALPDPVDGAGELLSSLREVEADYDEFQSAYVGLFDVGPGGPPCPLYGGAWGGDRQKAMEETLRFYNFFGLTLSAEQRDLPDHLATELEFLHFLAFKEVEALRSGADARPFRRACRDFLLRHPARWLPRLTARLERLQAPPFWASLLRLTAAFCRADARYLVGTEGPVGD